MKPCRKSPPKRWRKSRRSESQSNCVELADLGEAVGIRDSKNAEGPHLRVEARAFAGLVAGIRAGRYDR